ncbi:MAG TPA: hypothetical protein DEB09_04645 [Candidatus Magasanikbacteria bacterium]|nr:hypothetical protein [Candidatus Magasanikbacteria bacterium]
MGDELLFGRRLIDRPDVVAFDSLDLELKELEGETGVHQDVAGLHPLILRVDVGRRLVATSHHEQYHGQEQSHQSQIHETPSGFGWDRKIVAEKIGFVKSLGKIYNNLDSIF